MRTTQPAFYLISAELSDKTSEENSNATEDLESYLTKVNMLFKPVTGVYKGVMEQSFLVLTINPYGMISLAEQYGQESVLFVDGNREATLIFTDAETPPRYVGKWTSIIASEAVRSENYTQDGDNFYTTKRIV